MSHCAAGVRWLRYLHARAQGEQQEQRQPGGAAPTGHDSIAASEAAASAAHALASCSITADVAASGDTAAGTAASGGAAAAGGEGWAAHARRYPCVEEWFHALVRENFWGPLKVHACIYRVWLGGMLLAGTIYRG